MTYYIPRNRQKEPNKYSECPHCHKKGLYYWRDIRRVGSGRVVVGGMEICRYCKKVVGV